MCVCECIPLGNAYSVLCRIALLPCYQCFFVQYYCVTRAIVNIQCWQCSRDYRRYLLLCSVTHAELMVMFERQLYPVREDVGSLSYRLIASSTASFPYNVVITAEDGTAICEYMGCEV